MPEPKNIINAQHISMDPFSVSVEKWANQTKDYFNYDILLGFWEVKNFYIAILRRGEWIDICHVSDEPFVNSKSVPFINIVNEKHEYINDNKRMAEELKKDPSLGNKMIFYKEKYALNSTRIVFDKQYLNKRVNVEITIIKDFKNVKSAEPDLITDIIIK